MGLVDRARGIILNPREEWRAIDTEQTTVGNLYRSYVAPLAAIGPIATIIGSSVFGVTVPLVGAVRASPGAALAQGVVTYVLTLAGTYVFALVIDALAPTFAGTKNATQALKLAVYASTAAWLAGVFAIVPVLGILGLVGLYSLYLLYLGLPVLMKAPQDRALTYTVAVVVVAIVIYVVVGAIAASLAAPLFAT